MPMRTRLTTTFLLKMDDKRIGKHVKNQSIKFDYCNDQARGFCPDFYFTKNIYINILFFFGGGH